MNELPLQSFRLKNFKAVQDSGIIKFSPLTVFIGNNGSGKSSLIEGLEMLQIVTMNDLDEAMKQPQWGRFENILNKATSHTLVRGEQGRPYSKNPLSFDLQSKLKNESNFGYNVRYKMEIGSGLGGNEVFIRHESLAQRGGRNVPSFVCERNDSGSTSIKYTVDDEERVIKTTLVDGVSLINLSASGLPDEILLKEFIQQWQFVSFIPQKMGMPTPRTITGRQIKLEKDGSNIAEYLFDIQRLDNSVFESIASALQYVLPYSQDLQVQFASELQRSVYLQLTEGKFKVPGWLLSTGTLRIVALLALLRHPQPPPLIVIDEIENGLDPRSVHLIIEEMRSAIEDGKTQIIMTTHSPYLLNLLRLEEVVLVERVEGQPVFTRPGNDKSLQQWAEDYGPGDLYVMSKLNTKGK